VQVLGISADHSFAQKTFAESLQLPYPLLSNAPGLQVIRNYGVLWPHQIGPLRDANVVIDHRPNTAARRAFFLVDQQGIVRGKWLVDNEGGRVALWRGKDADMVNFGRRTFGVVLLGTVLGLSLVAIGPRPVTAVEVGEPAPAFMLASTMGGDVSLKDFRGKKWVLLEFYGADFAPV